MPKWRVRRSKEPLQRFAVIVLGKISAERLLAHEDIVILVSVLRFFQVTEKIDQLFAACVPIVRAPTAAEAVLSLSGSLSRRPWPDANAEMARQARRRRGEMLKTSVANYVAFGGKTDMTFCTAYVCFCYFT